MVPGVARWVSWAPTRAGCALETVLVLYLNLTSNVDKEAGGRLPKYLAKREFLALHS